MYFCFVFFGVFWGGFFLGGGVCFVFGWVFFFILVVFNSPAHILHPPNDEKTTQALTQALYAPLTSVEIQIIIGLQEAGELPRVYWSSHGIKMLRSH